MSRRERDASVGEGFDIVALYGQVVLEVSAVVRIEVAVDPAGLMEGST